MDRTAIDNQIRAHYEKVWQTGDAWNLEASEFEQARYDFLVTKLADRRYANAMEIGCGSGGLTRRLAKISDRLLALDVAAAAIERARPQLVDSKNVDLRVANIMEFDFEREGPWDLIVLAETIYSIGWLYPFFEVSYLAMKLLAALSPGGRLLLTNTEDENGWLLKPAIIQTYRDLFRNVGFKIVSEEYFVGMKNETEMRVLVTLFEKSKEAL